MDPRARGSFEIEHIDVCDSHLLRGCGYVGASVGFVSGASFSEVFEDFEGKILLVYLGKFLVAVKRYAGCGNLPKVS